MRRTIISAVTVGVLAVVPAAFAAHTGADYKGSTSQGKTLAFNLDKNGGSRMLPSFRIAFDAPCAGTALTYHGTARLSGVGVEGGRFVGSKHVQSVAGSNQVANLAVSLHGAFAKGGKRASGRWHTKVRIEDRKGNTVARCRTGLLKWKVKRVARSKVL